MEESVEAVRDEEVKVREEEVTHYEDTKGDTKCRKLGGLG